MGKADEWQSRVVKAFENEKVIFLNPRRDDWDSSWVQSKDNAQFRKQVEWELTAQTLADVIVMYFDPTTKSPITLLELGLFRHKDLIVCCPEGFWRKGNVDIVCEFYKIKQVADLTELVLEVRKRLTK